MITIQPNLSGGPYDCLAKVPWTLPDEELHNVRLRSCVCLVRHLTLKGMKAVSCPTVYDLEVCSSCAPFQFFFNCTPGIFLGGASQNPFLAYGSPVCCSAILWLVINYKSSKAVLQLSQWRPYPILYPQAHIKKIKATWPCCEPICLCFGSLYDLD